MAQIRTASRPVVHVGYERPLLLQEELSAPAGRGLPSTRLRSGALREDARLFQAMSLAPPELPRQRQSPERGLFLLKCSLRQTHSGFLKKKRGDRSFFHWVLAFVT